MKLQPEANPRLGPKDKSRRMTYAEFMATDYELGSYYELADGRLCVWPFPELGHAMVADWLQSLFMDYRLEHKEVANFCTSKGYVTIPNRKRDTATRPDLSVYRGVPRLALNLTWRDISPLLVAEVTAPEHAEKDVSRNVRLYLQVPSIVEYWLIDARESLSYPTLRVHRRNGRKWKIIEVAPKESYTTPLLPGFELLNDHRHHYEGFFNRAKKHRKDQQGKAKPRAKEARR